MGIPCPPPLPTRVIIAIFETLQTKTKHLWVKAKVFFPNQLLNRFFESLGPDIRLYALVSFDISPPCADNTPK